MSVSVVACWCGTRNPYFAPVYSECSGTGTIYCYCGGDFCVCHHHGEIECPGCVNCEDMDDSDIGEGEDWR